MNNLDIESTKILSWMYENKYVKITLLILFALYFTLSPKVPKTVRLLYDNIVFRILIILLIIFLSMHDHQLAIMITIVYLLTINNIKSYNEDDKDNTTLYNK